MTPHPKAAATRAAARLRAAPAPQPLDVFEAKLRVPAPRGGAVSRTALVNRLRAEQARIVSIVAPAGYGKTTLLAQWAERDERPFAWVSVDAHDNDPHVLLVHLAAALARIEAPADVAGALVAEASVWRTAAPRVVRAFASSSQPSVLVLDDAGLLEARDAADILHALAEAVPAGSTLVLAGRDEPALPLARLRERGTVLELGADDLRLTRREALLLVRGVGAKPNEAELDDLVVRTEGWAAGLHLAAAGPESALAAYLRAEVFPGIGSERLTFLRRCSVLDRLSGPLCNVVLGRKGSAAELEALERASLFLTPVDRSGGWYRLHRILREELRRALEQHEPELVPTLHERAVGWFEAHGDLESAFRHVDVAADPERAARLLLTIALPAYYGGRIGEVEAWVERFAASAPLEEHTGVAVLAGWLHALAGRPEDATRSLAAAERGPAGGPLPDGSPSSRPWLRLFRAALAPAGPERMEEDAAAALLELSAESRWIPVALLVEGAAAALRGELALADARFAASADAAQRLGTPITRTVAIAQRSLLVAEAGEHRAAEELALEARAILDGNVFDDYATAAVVRAAAARAFLRHGRWDLARQELEKAEALSGSLTHALPWFAVEVRLSLARGYVALRDRDRAAAELAEIDRVLAVRPDLGALVDQVAGLREEVAGLPDPRDGHHAGLTAAELRLVPLLATHLSFREIGERLFVSRNTIKTQAISTYRKLGVTSRSAAIQRAAELGLVDDATAAPPEITPTR
jgi:LuxR family maltose regulon positive regulatory protein